MTEPSLDLEKLRSLLAYEPETGVLRWRKNKGTVLAGDVAGSLDSRGYRYVHIDRKRYRASRLIWFHVHGCWPKKCLDHINCCRDDNRLVNLREATLAQNSANKRSWKGRPKGVVELPNNRWRANFTKEGKTRYLGTFDSFDDAHAAYKRVALDANGEFARLE